VIATPVVALSASPARVAIAPLQTQELHVTNTGRSAAIVLASRAGFELAPRGRPRVVARERPAWLRIRPQRLRLGPRQTATVYVTAARAEPGDHPALLLLRTEPLARGGVSVRMQIGVVVVLHAPGRAVHAIRLLRARRHGRTLRLLVANRGNVTEQLADVPVSIIRGGHVVAHIHSRPRELLPRGTALVQLTLPPRLRGRLSVAMRGRTLRARER
jgi:hypothetical protein